MNDAKRVSGLSIDDGSPASHIIDDVLEAVNTLLKNNGLTTIKAYTADPTDDKHCIVLSLDELSKQERNEAVTAMFGI